MSVGKSIMSVERALLFGKGHCFLQKALALFLWKGPERALFFAEHCVASCRTEDCFLQKSLGPRSYRSQVPGPSWPSSSPSSHCHCHSSIRKELCFLQQWHGFLTSCRKGPHCFLGKKGIVSWKRHCFIVSWNRHCS